MKTSITKGIKDKQTVADLTSSFTASYRLRERLILLLNNKVHAKDAALLSDDSYDCANWAYKMADSQGYKKAISELISLLS